MRIGGVYQIVCKPTGQFYVGCTIDFAARQMTHLSQLRCGIHYNSNLQAAYNYWGEKKFVFAVIQSWGSPDYVSNPYWETTMRRESRGLESEIMQFNSPDRIFNVAVEGRGGWNPRNLIGKSKRKPFHSIRMPEKNAANNFEMPKRAGKQIPARD